ncbi:hypothetical protein [Avibacterium sp. 20-129]|uniref:hypothetical protein n=1 Tax=Avibacterium sp. 20-129 TaxID=2911525 RepID=UPI00224541F0|nr:hypothetical protein [Avibacterium sp. 20-129]MCW9699714.1 hypothetical protein [Avibacterium sp. 20-129]
MILLSKFAITAEQVWQMPLLEVFAWIESYLESEGVKTPHGPMGANNSEVKHESYIFTRRGKIE